MEEQRRSGQGDSSSTLSYESPMPDPSLEGPPKDPLPGFREIAQSFTGGQPPWVTSKVPQDLMLPSLLVRPTMTTLTSTRINQDEATGITYVDMVTASVGLVALETSHRAVGPHMPILEEGAQGESTVIIDVTNL